MLKQSTGENNEKLIELKKSKNEKIGPSIITKNWVFLAIQFGMITLGFVYVFIKNGFSVITIYSFLVCLLLTLTFSILGIVQAKREKKSEYGGYRDYLLRELKKYDNTFTESAEINKNAKNKNIKNKDLNDDNVAAKQNISEKNILIQMIDNNDEIKEYFKISKRQAKLSFGFSVFACIVGILMMGFAIYGTIIIGNLQIAIIGTISGAITEVISGTVLWVHNKSALQLNHYYDALHQNEKFLSAINLVDRLGHEKQEEMYIEIIRKQIDIHNTGGKTEVNE